jgi:predicted nucleotidyltransferase
MNCDVNDPLQKTLADITVFLQEAGISFALIGGQATSLLGQERVTADIDMVIAADVQSTLALTRTLESSNFRALFDDIDEVIQRAFILPLRHRSTDIKVDLAIGLSGFEQTAISRAMLLDLAGVKVPVATAEDLLIMKILAGRPRDEQDVRGLVIVQGPTLDWAYCESTASELGEAIGIDLVQRIRALRRGHSLDP